MLCDLQCRSTARSSSSNSNRLVLSNPSTSWWTNLFLYLMTLQLQTTCKTLLLALWTHSPSRVTRLMEVSTHRLTSRLRNSSTMTQRLPLPSTLVLAQLNAATGRVPTQQQGALARAALQRRLLVEFQRTGMARLAAAEQLHQTSRDSPALQEHRSDDHSCNSSRDGGDEAGC